MDWLTTQLMVIGAEIWKEFVYILPFLLIGVFIEALIRTFKWHVKIRNALTQHGILSIVIATLLGVASPLCACSILPMVISLLLAGLPLAPAMSLLVTSPIMSPAGYTLLNWELGLSWANAVLSCAIFMGLFVGYITHYLRPYGFTEDKLFRKTLPAGDFHSPDYPVEALRCDCGKQLSHTVERCTHNKFLVFCAKAWEGGIKITKFAMLGLFIEVLTSNLIPQEWISALLEGQGIWPIVTITFASIPLHLPQITAASMLYGFVSPEEGATAINLAKGAGVALLVGGPMTALPVMGVLITMFRKRVLFLYMTLCAVGTLLVSLTFHFLPIQL